MIISEERLHIDLTQGEHPTERPLVLEPQHRLSMVLSRLPYTVGSSNKLARILDTDVEDQVDSPVEHLDEKGKLLYKSRVPVLGVAGRVGRTDDGAAATALLGRVDFCQRRGRRCGSGEVETLCLVVNVFFIPWLEFRLAQQALILFGRRDDGEVT
ncbi:hypothetical protein HG531_000981 [Fusarium graminearum]|nr:hypothetical protein HG531_000981 [Fusarium graminearum]